MKEGSLGLTVPRNIMLCPKHRKGNSDCEDFEQQTAAWHCECTRMLIPGKNNKRAPIGQPE